MRLTKFILGAALLLALPKPGFANVISYGFTGVVTDTVDANPTRTIAGHFTLNTDVPITWSGGSSLNANYHNAVEGFDIAGISLGSYTQTLNGVSVNLEFIEDMDSFGVAQWGWSPDLDFLLQLDVTFTHQSLTNSNIPNADELTLTADSLVPPYAGFFSVQFLETQHLSPVFKIAGYIDSIQSQTVPEPPSWAALVVGLIMLWKRRATFRESSHI